MFGGAAGPPTTVFFLSIIDNYFSDVIIIEVAAVSGW